MCGSRVAPLCLTAVYICVTLCLCVGGSTTQRSCGDIPCVVLTMYFVLCKQDTCWEKPVFADMVTKVTHLYGCHRNLCGTRTHTHAHTHTHTCTHEHAHVRTHAHGHVHARTHAHGHAHTHAHTRQICCGKYHYTQVGHQG